MKTKLIAILCIFVITNIAFALKYEINTQAVTVTTTATKLPATPLVGRKYLLVTNNDASTTIYIGDSTVTSSGATIGTPLLPKEQYYGTWDGTIDIYGIVSAGSVTAIVEEGK